MRTKDFRINVNQEILACSVDYSDETKRPNVISLHGGGPSTRESTAYLSEIFNRNGQNVVRFDFSGQGQSTGSMPSSSLKKRHDEAMRVIEYFKMKNDLTVIGTSMGGYIASTLVPHCQILNLILFCPAAYTKKAWDIEFGKGFTEVIRKEKSYQETDLQNLLEHFSGNSLIFMDANDEIIPTEVVERYESSLSKSKQLKKIIIDDCPHPIHRWTGNRTDIQEWIKDQIEDFIGIGKHKK